MNRIAEVRKQHHLTQKDLGSILGAAQNTISNWESEKRSPDYASLQKMAQYFGVTIDWLLGLDAKKAPPTPEGEGRLPDDERRLLALFHQLNREGRERLVEIADDMVSSGKYIKTDPSTLGVSPA